MYYDCLLTSSGGDAQLQGIWVIYLHAGLKDAAVECICKCIYLTKQNGDKAQCYIF